MTRRPALVLAAVLLAGGSFLAGSASAATPNDAVCTTASGSGTTWNSARVKAYTACRDDKIDAQLAALGAPSPSDTPTPIDSPAPTVTPTTTSPSPTDEPTSASPSPTRTPSPTPTPTASSPAPADFPDAGSTGVPAGVTLSSYTGPATITTAGTVIDGKKITSCLVVKANNVTVKNSLITGSCFFNVLNDSGNTGLLLSDIEIDGQNSRADGAAIGGRNYTCTRCDIHGTGDGLKLGDNVTVQDSWIHNLYGANDSHNDGMQASDGSNIVVRHNTITPVYSGSTSAIIIKGDFGKITDLTFDGNFVGGGAWTVYGGDGYGNGIPDATGVKITNNRFTTAYWPKGGAFGPITNTGSGVTVSGNAWADGANKGKAVS